MVRAFAMAMLLSAAVVAQSEHGPYYGQPNTKCWRGETATQGGKTRVHCDCKLDCQNDPPAEDPKCQTYCTHDAKPEDQQCICHTDEACH